MVVRIHLYLSNRIVQSGNKNVNLETFSSRSLSFMFSLRKSLTNLFYCSLYKADSECEIQKKTEKNQCC